MKELFRSDVPEWMIVSSKNAVTKFKANVICNAEDVVEGLPPDGLDPNTIVFFLEEKGKDDTIVEMYNRKEIENIEIEGQYKSFTI